MKEASLALAALGHATRLSVYRLLVEAGPEGRSHGAIAEALGLAAATLSFHLKELAAAGLVRGEQCGRSTCYRVDFATMDTLIGFLTRNCCAGSVRAGSATCSQAAEHDG